MRGASLNPQHFQVKVFAQEPWPADIKDATPVFHRWIQSKALPELLIDVADYRHVPEGPGIVLIAHEAHYALDFRQGRLGLLYARKTALDGSAEDRLRQALQAALSAARLMEQEPEFAGRLRFNAGEIEIRVNDRLLAPNTEETWRELQPVIETVLDSVWGGGQYRLKRAGEPRELFTVVAERNEPLPLSAVA